jgi:hypothetical protein
MMFGYYDRTGYSNMYAGPTNGGVCPLNNSGWGYKECSLSATHQGYDGLAVKGHVDDYWYAHGSTVDPYDGNWTEHGYADCTADFMGTNQYVNWQNRDGGTRFYFSSSGAPLYDYTGCEPGGKRDGCHGIRLFVESRGYIVIQNYNQYIHEHVAGGFTYANFKAEIDAGRPVIIQVERHSMLGYGYDDPDTIYIHDAWDHSDHSMTWGGTYSGSKHYAVAVIEMLYTCGNMGVNPTSWSPTLNCSESDNEIVTVSATGGIVEGVTVSKVSCPTWLSVSPTNLGDIASGSSKTFTVTAAPPDGTSGDFTYTVRVSNTCGTPSSRDVTGTITVYCPELSYSPASHDFGDKYEGETDSTTFEVWNSGTGTLTYSVSETCDWVEVNPTSGSSTGEHDTITIDIDTTGLSEGLHTCDITINSNDGSGTFTVRVNIVPKPDLMITEKWLCWPDNCTICYNVTNIGNGTAPACHNTTLYVDDVEVARDHVPVDLAPGESYIGCFEDYTWAYTPPSDNITVCADNNVTLDELDENNNCLTNIWMCGDVNSDGKVTMSDVRKVFNRYLDPNYPLDLPWAADVNCDGRVTMSDVRKVFNRYLDSGYELNCCCEEVA